MGRCGALLGSRSDAYGTGAAVDDMVDVLDALGLARVDVYGDSYGSFAAQTLALRHPERVRSLVLDGTYPLDFDPWRATRSRCCAARCARPATARRPARGAAAIRSSAWRRSRAQLRARPLVATARDAGGQLVHVRLDDRGLAGVLSAADGELAIYRDLPAAAEAYDHGDRAPLARLAAEAFAGGANGPAQYYSAGARRGRRVPRLSAALRRRAARPPERLAQLDGGPARDCRPTPSRRSTRRPGSAPISRATTGACAGRARPTRPIRRARPAPPIPSVPTLVLDGDLDQRTSLIGARARRRRSSPDSTLVRRPEPGPRDGARRLARLRRRASCGASSRRPACSGAACAAENPPLHLVEAFPRTSRSAPEARAASGDGRSPAQRRTAWCAAQAVADAVTRYPLIPGSSGVGLRGGRFSARGAYLSSRPLRSGCAACASAPTCRSPARVHVASRERRRARDDPFRRAHARSQLVAREPRRRELRGAAPGAHDGAPLALRLTLPACADPSRRPASSPVRCDWRCRACRRSPAG